jgi:hypothetical protein
MSLQEEAEAVICALRTELSRQPSQRSTNASDAELRTAIATINAWETRTREVSHLPRLVTDAWSLCAPLTEHVVRFAHHVAATYRDDDR